MRKTTLIVAICVAMLGWTSSAAAEKTWTVRVGALWVDVDPDFRLDEDGVRLSGDAGLGFSLAGEYRVDERLGVELGAQWSENDLELQLFGGMFCGPILCTMTATDSVQPLTLSLGLDVHLTPNRRADLYVGPLLAYVLYGEPTFRYPIGTLRASIDDDFAWGGVVGLDVPFGDRGWRFSSSVRYLRAEADARARDDEGESDAVSLDLDQLAVVVGFGYRF